jgi:DNA-binding transcriptional regulator YiaG
MAKKFSELRARMSPESRARAESKAKEMLAEMPLNELRHARGLSQKMLAEALNVQQPSAESLSMATQPLPRRQALAVSGALSQSA